MKKIIIGLTLATFILFVYTSNANIVKQEPQKTQVTAKADSKTTTDKKCADTKACNKDGKCCKKDGKKCDTKCKKGSTKDTKKESEPK